MALAIFVFIKSSSVITADSVVLFFIFCPLVCELAAGDKSAASLGFIWTCRSAAVNGVLFAILAPSVVVPISFLNRNRTIVLFYPPFYLIKQLRLQFFCIRHLRICPLVLGNQVSNDFWIFAIS